MEPFLTRENSLDKTDLLLFYNIKFVHILKVETFYSTSEIGIFTKCLLILECRNHFSLGSRTKALKNRDIVFRYRKKKFVFSA